jgi:pyruvate dehydrogenase E1 component
VKTVKGWALGPGFEGKNVAHQLKKLNTEQLRAFRDKLELPIPDEALEEAPPYFHPGEGSPEVRYLRERRKSLGGPLPRRARRAPAPRVPAADLYEEFRAGSAEGQEVSTTMAFVRLLRKLVREPEIGKRIVPIIPDEARTFGMESLFKDLGIYSPGGQLYEPVDHDLVLRYREAADGQILEEGITEAGSLASFTAAATSYSTHSVVTIPFYIFYSMFGFQRVGDLVWAVGDGLGRGFLLGATAGRTTLAGEGLQHDDGHSHVLASVIPNIRAYDPAYAYELATIVRAGLEAMVEREEDCFYYLTLYNENYPMPPMPEGSEEGIVRGIHRVRERAKMGRARVALLGSGPVLREVLRGSEILESRFDVGADVWSVTSWQQLRAEALEVERWNRLHPEESRRTPYVTRMLEGAAGPVVAATDYMKLVPDMVAPWIPGGLVSLGTDGYGFSDTRPALRRHFEVDAEHIAAAALSELARRGTIAGADAAAAIRVLGLDPEKPDPARA